MIETESITNCGVVRVYRYTARKLSSARFAGSHDTDSIGLTSLKMCGGNSRSIGLLPTSTGSVRLSVIVLPRVRAPVDSHLKA
jgi:hypothetical protein